MPALGNNLVAACLGMHRDTLAAVVHFHVAPSSPTHTSLPANRQGTELAAGWATDTSFPRHLAQFVVAVGDSLGILETNLAASQRRQYVDPVLRGPNLTTLWLFIF